MHDHDPLDLVDLDDTHVDLVHTAIPVLCEAIAVIIMIGCAMVWMIVLATPVPA